MNYDRLILELMDRVSALEDEVATLKKQNTVFDKTPINNNEIKSPIYNSRDKTKYILNGTRYGKNRLVLAIVTEYFKRNPDVSAETLISTFSKSLQGSLGVVRTLNDVKNNYFDYEKRFFCKPNEIIHTHTDDCVVCTQWGVSNINSIIARAKELGINVTIL